MALATLTVDLNASIAKFEQDLKKAVSSSEQTSKKIGEAFKSVGELAGISVGLAGFIDLMKDAVARATDMERSQNLLAATLKATGFSAGLTARQLDDMAGALSKSTAFDDDDIKKAEIELLRFRDIHGETFREALKATLDYAAATQGKAADAASTLGKALEDPLHSMKALKDVGIILTQAQKDLIASFQDTGNATGAAGVVLDALKGRVGGDAAAENVGLYGATRSASKAWDDLLKSLGSSPGVQGPVTSTLNGIAAGLNALVEGGKKVRESGFASGNAFDYLGKHLGTPAAADAADPQKEQAAAGAAARAQEVMREKALADAKAARAANLQEITATLSRQLQIESQAASQSQAMLDIKYARGLVSEKAYYSARGSIASTEATKEIADIQKAIDAQVAVRADKGTKEERAPIDAEIARLKAQQQAIAQGAANASTLNSEKLKDAQKAFGEAVAKTTIDLEAQNFEFVKAAQGQIDLTHASAEYKRLSQDPTAKANLALLDAETLRVAQLNTVLREETVIKTNLSTKEQEIANAFTRAGPDGELAALEATNKARLDSVAAQEKEISEKERLANGNVVLLAQYKAERAGLDGMVAGATGAAEAMAKLNIAQQHTGVLLGQESLAEADIQNKRTAGSITTMEALQQTDEVRKASIDRLKDQLALEEKLAAAGGDEQAKLRVQQLRVEIDALAASSNEAARVYTDVFQSSFESGFESFINGSKSASGAFSDFASSVAKGLQHIAAQELSQQLFKGLTGGGSSGGGTGGYIGALASLFGGSSGGVGDSGGVSLYGSAGGNVIGSRGAISLSRFAGGGIANRPTLSLFGEGRKPEAYVPLPDGRRIPVAMSGGGGGGVNVQMTINTPDANSFRKSNGQILTEMQGSLARAGSRR